MCSRSRSQEQKNWIYERSQVHTFAVGRPCVVLLLYSSSFVVYLNVVVDSDVVATRLVVHRVVGGVVDEMWSLSLSVLVPCWLVAGFCLFVSEMSSLIIRRS